MIDEKGMRAVNRAIRDAPVAGRDGDTYVVPSASQEVLRAAITAYLSTLSLGTRITLVDGTEAVVVPVEPDDTIMGPGVYAAADILCASEFCNAPDASFILSLAHRAFADGHRAMLSALERPDE